MKAPTRLLRLWLGFCLRTTSWQVIGPHDARALLTSNDTGTLAAFWHRGLILAPALVFWAQRTRPDIDVRIMVSRNRDGRLIAEIVRPWGIASIHGSTTKRDPVTGVPTKHKGGSAALRAALNALSEGAIVAITPDGPHGPAEQLHPGAATLARLARCHVVPIGFASTNPALPTWDRLAFPLPFGRGVVQIGSPLLQPDTETLRHALLDASARATRRLRLSSRTPFDLLWYFTGILAAPVLRVTTRMRIRQGREIAGRTHERRGLGRAKRPSDRRPGGPVLWVHAASVGETLSALPLLDALLGARSDLHILFTTATVTGAEIVSRHPLAGQRITHRFIPHDVGRWVRRFLAFWSPDGAVFIESELWPGIIAACHRCGIPLMLVNGRLSDRSAARWKRVPGIAGRLLARLEWVAARGPEDARHFRTLGATAVYEDGDLKQDAPALPCNMETLAELRAAIGVRRVFVAASTHPGEEEIIAAAAERARAELPDLLTIIVPRHPTRGLALGTALSAPVRSSGVLPDANTTLWIADTLGELGMFYRLADRVFLGNSLCHPGGGHNPFEPLRLGAPVAVGPNMTNWREAMTLLHDRLHIVSDAATLARWVCADDADRIAAGAVRQSVVPALCARILATINP